MRIFKITLLAAMCFALLTGCGKQKENCFPGGNVKISSKKNDIIKAFNLIENEEDDGWFKAKKETIKIYDGNYNLDCNFEDDSIFVFMATRTESEPFYMEEFKKVRSELEAVYGETKSKTVDGTRICEWDIIVDKEEYTIKLEYEGAFEEPGNLFITVM